MRAWVVAHDGFRVGTVVAVVGVALSVYAYASVPSFSGGVIPMWFLTPPTLAMFAALAVHNEITGVGWSTGRLRRARFAWALTIMTLTGGCAAMVGAHAGHSRLPELTVVLTAMTLGLAVPIGRGSAVVGAAGLLVIVMSTHTLRNQTPADLWDALGGPAGFALAVACTACVGSYVHSGSRGARASLTE